MNIAYPEARQYEADFAATSAFEFDELDESAIAVELALLAAKVQAARYCGA